MAKRRAARRVGGGVGGGGRGALRRAAALLLVAAGGWLSPAQAAGGAAAVEFVAFGDMPYGNAVTTGPAWREMLRLVNAQQLPLAIHVGDFKDGLAACDDALYAERRADFDSLHGALVLTPGDNDWLDCARRRHDPLERLQHLRQVFFDQPRSLGQHPIPVERQSDRMPAHRAYRENLRWWLGPVLFVTFHTVGLFGSTDSLPPALRDEYLAREEANAAWIREAYALALTRGAQALVLATQSGLVSIRGVDRAMILEPYVERSVRQTLLPLAAQNPQLPVLVIHGDGHMYHFDQPFRDPQGRLLAHLWRLEVHGDPRMHATRVRVEPGRRAAPFSMQLIWNPLSPDPTR